MSYFDQHVINSRDEAKITLQDAMLTFLSDLRVSDWFSNSNKKY